METIDKSLIGVAGEFLVAAELCRRGIYAQPTFGNQKRIDLLAFGDRPGKIVKLEVKSKQQSDWPNCKGIHEADTFLVFVDFHERTPEDKPEFFVLSAAEWRSVVMKVKRDYQKNHPSRRAVVGKDNVLVLPDEVNKQGKPYQGAGVKPEMIKAHAGAWHKIKEALG